MDHAATDRPLILDAHGRPARRPTVESKDCPRCGAGPEKRVASGGFGAAHPVCGSCGFEWLDEVWRG